MAYGEMTTGRMLTMEALSPGATEGIRSRQEIPLGVALAKLEIAQQDRDSERAREIHQEELAYLRESRGSAERLSRDFFSQGFLQNKDMTMTVLNKLGPLFEKYLSAIAPPGPLDLPPSPKEIEPKPTATAAPPPAPTVGEAPPPAEKLTLPKMPAVGGPVTPAGLYSTQAAQPGGMTRQQRLNLLKDLTHDVAPRMGVLPGELLSVLDALEARHQPLSQQDQALALSFLNEVAGLAAGEPTVVPVKSRKETAKGFLRKALPLASAAVGTSYLRGGGLRPETNPAPLHEVARELQGMIDSAWKPPPNTQGQPTKLQNDMTWPAYLAALASLSEEEREDHLALNYPTEQHQKIVRRMLEPYLRVFKSAPSQSIP